MRSYKEIALYTLGFIFLPWASIALGSYVYLYGLDAIDYWAFPFMQLPHGLADTDWHGGLEWMMTLWQWRIVGLIVTLAPIVAVCRTLLWRWRSRLTPQLGGGLRPLKRGVTDNHGHAMFASNRQIARHFQGPGCLIGGLSPDNGARLFYDNPNKGPGHSMVLAGPGSNKTATLISRIWYWDGPRVVFDPSCEIGPIMTQALQNDGFNVHTIGMAPDGSGLNVLDWIDIQDPESDSHIKQIVELIYDERSTLGDNKGGEKNPFWAITGRALCSCLLAHTMHHCPVKTLVSFRQAMATPENDMPALLTNIHQTSNSPMARDIASGMMKMKSDETFSSIRASAFAATEWLSVKAYADVVSGDAMKTADILDDGTVVFIQIPMLSLLATPAVGRAVIGAFLNAMFHADGGADGERILFAIDEAAIMGCMKEIRLCHTTGRKYRGSMQTIWQSEAQLEETWGQNGAQIMRDTVSWRSYNAIQDGKVAERLSTDLGSHAVMAHSEGDNQGRQIQGGFGFGSRSRGSNISTHEIKRRLITADEIMRAPADKIWVLARDFPWPIEAWTAPYYRTPDIDCLMSDSRFVRG